MGRALCSGSSAACGPSTAAAYTNPLLSICSTSLRGTHTHMFTHYLFQHQQQWGLIIVLVSPTSNLIHCNKTCVCECVADKEKPELWPQWNIYHPDTACNTFNYTHFFVLLLLVLQAFDSKLSIVSVSHSASFAPVMGDNSLLNDLRELELSKESLLTF